MSSASATTIAGVATAGGSVAPPFPARLGFADLDALLTPVHDGAPTGESLRYDGIYDRLREARREEDASAPQGIWKRDLKRADWAEVDRVGSTALVMRGKDLQVAAWLLEAWVYLHGFAGARQGFALLLRLCERYWPELHPLPDGDDFGARILTIEWVNERLRVPLESVPVTKPADHGVRAWTWAEREATLDRENRLRRASGAHDALDDDDRLTSVAFATSAEVTPRVFYAESVEDLGDAIASARALEMLLDECCGRDAPGLTQVVGAMSRIREWMQPMAASPNAVPAEMELSPDIAPEPEATPAEVPMPGGSMEPTPDAGAAAPVDHARARAEAYKKLADAAHTLMRLEPHSPTPYLVRRAIAWGGMSLAELMRHFIDSGYDLKSLYSMLGMGETERE
jgi:type VI secretion system protein ImpA